MGMFKGLMGRTTLPKQISCLTMHMYVDMFFLVTNMHHKASNKCCHLAPTLEHFEVTLLHLIIEKDYGSNGHVNKDILNFTLCGSSVV